MLKVKALVLGFTIAISASYISGCYQMPINQGNQLEQTAVKRLKTGMTREQVRYLMGAPILQDPFDQSRWNYISRYKTKTGEYKEHRLILRFEDDVLTQIIGGDDLPTPEEETDEKNAEMPAL